MNTLFISALLSFFFIQQVSAFNETVSPTFFLRENVVINTLLANQEHCFLSNMNRSCAEVPDPSAALVRLTGADYPYDFAPPGSQTIRGNHWFVYPDAYSPVNYGLIAGDQSRGHFFWIYNKNSASVQMNISTAGTFGFSQTTQSTNVDAADTILINGITYAVIGGFTALSSYTVKLFKLDTAGQLFSEITNAFSPQPTIYTLKAVRWHTSGGIPYLALGFSDSTLSSRLFLFNPSTETLTQSSSGIAGFDVQHPQPINGIDWFDINGNTYCVTAGNQSTNEYGQSVSVRLYQLNTYTHGLDAVIQGVSGLDVQPITPVGANCVAAQQIDAQTAFVAVGCQLSQSLTLYKFNTTTGLLTLIPNAFDYLPNNVISASWINSNGVFFLATGGDTGNIQLYRLNQETGAMTSQVVTGPAFPPTANTNYVSGIVINDRMLVSVGYNQISGGESSIQMYAGGLISDPYCTETNLIINKTVNNDMPVEGSNVTFTITLTNYGPAQATNILVQDILPAGLTFVSSNASQGTYNNTTGLWAVGTLIANQSVTLDITVTIDMGFAGTLITNSAGVISFYGATDPYPSNLFATSSVLVQAIPNSVRAGSILFYNIASLLPVCNTVIQ